MGATELRLVLAVANLAAWRWPMLSLFGVETALFDVIGALAALGLAGVLLVQVPRLSATLRKAETRQ